LRRLPGSRATPIVVYGIDVPGVKIEHVAGLDVATTRLVKDLAPDRIVQAVLDASRR